LDTVARTLDSEAVERVAFRKAELAADHMILGDRVAVDLDPLHINARRFVDDERHPHLALFLVAIKAGVDVGKRVAEEADRFRQARHRVLDLLGIVPIALLHRKHALEVLFLDVANLAFEIDFAELVALAFIHHVGDDEVLAVRRQLGDR